MKKKADLTVFFNLDSVDLAILVFAFTFDIITKIFIPIALCFSTKILVRLLC